MKKLIVLGLAAVGLSLYACSGGGNDTPNPNNAAEQFENPTGKLTSSNANAVAQASLDAQNSNGISSIGALRQNKPSSSNINPSIFLGENCIETSGNSTTLDWECFIPVVFEECTGSGNTVSTVDQGAELATTQYNEAGIDCPDGGSEVGFDFTCDGEITTSLNASNTGYSCYDLECTTNAQNTSFNGCVNPEGDLLVFVDGDSYVSLSVDVNADCSEVVMSHYRQRWHKQHHLQCN
jgi:hypothetical protein